MSDQEIREEAAYALGVQACLWGLPLVEYAVTLAAALKAGGTRVSGLRYFDDLKTADDRFVVTPNNVTIDGYAAADLRAEPVVVSVPALAEDRWYIVQIGDYYDEIVHNIGGYRGPEPGLYLISGPDYHGRVPQAMTEVKVRTRFAVTALRVLVRGDADLPGARAAQRGFRVMPLSAFEQHGLSYADPGGSQLDTIPPFEPGAPAELQPLEHLGFAMRQFLSTSDGVSDTFIRQLRAIGLTVTGGFDWRNLDKASQHGLARAIRVAEQIIDNAYYGAATQVNGWRYTLATGRAGHNFALRAAFAKYLVGANVPEQLTYPNTAVDADGDPLNRGQPLRPALRGRPGPARLGVLEHKHVRRGRAVHRQRLRPLLHRQHHRRAQGRPRRLDHHRDPARGSQPTPPTGCPLPPPARSTSPCACTAPGPPYSTAPTGSRPSPNHPLNPSRRLGRDLGRQVDAGRPLDIRTDDGCVRGGGVTQWVRGGYRWWGGVAVHRYRGQRPAVGG